MQLIFLAFDFWVDEIILSGIFFPDNDDTRHTFIRWNGKTKKVVSMTTYYCALTLRSPLFWGDRKVITEGLIKGGDWRYQYPHSFPTGIGKLPEIVVLGAISKEDLIDSLLGLKIFKADLAPYRIVLVVGRDGKIAEAMKTMFIKDEAKVLIMAPYEPRKITKYSPRYADYIPGAYPGQIAR